MNNFDIEVNEIMRELERLGKEQTKKTYMRHGAREPLFGVTTGDLKPLAKKFKKNYELAKRLYRTGNYDAMYLAGMITDPAKMTEADFDEWIAAAYCQGVSDYIVAVTLAESNLAQDIADKWINDERELYASAGWSSYEWLLGYQTDDHFDKDKMMTYLNRVESTIHTQPNRVRYAMNGYVIAVGISYLPLHNEALKAAKAIGIVNVDVGETSCKVPFAVDYINKAIDRNRIGFKRKKVRC